MRAAADALVIATPIRSLSAACRQYAPAMQTPECELRNVYCAPGPFAAAFTITHIARCAQGTKLQAASKSVGTTPVKGGDAWRFDEAAVLQILSYWKKGASKTASLPLTAHRYVTFETDSGGFNNIR